MIQKMTFSCFYDISPIVPPLLYPPRELYNNGNRNLFVTGENPSLIVYSNDNATESFIPPISRHYIEDFQTIENTTYFNVYKYSSSTSGIYSSDNWSKFETGFEEEINNFYVKRINPS